MISKRKMKKLRKTGQMAQTKVGHGHVVYSGFGTHHDKRRRSLERIRNKEIHE